MYIEYYSINGIEYARIRNSVRKDGGVSHGKSTTLGRVLDRKQLIFKSREHGTYQYDPDTGERKNPPDDFCLKIVRKNAREQLIVDFGNTYFIDRYIDQLGLWSVFDAIGYGNPDSFKALLCYYILESRSNAHAKDWYEGSYARIAYPKALLESPRISDMLSALGGEIVQRRFFETYIAYLKKSTAEAGKGYVLIDSTGLPNDIRLPITAVSNHNGEINNEVRLIYVVQRGTGMPIYMRYIPGNVVDVSTLLTTIAELKALKVDTKFAILDAGYLTLASIGILLDQKISFLARVKKNWSLYKEIVKNHRADLECDENRHTFHGRFVYLKQVAYQLSTHFTAISVWMMNGAAMNVDSWLNVLRKTNSVRKQSGNDCRTWAYSCWSVLDGWLSKTCCRFTTPGRILSRFSISRKAMPKRCLCACRRLTPFEVIC